jgi:hypothetical protein
MSKNVARKRPTIFAFHVNIPAVFTDPIAFLNTSLTAMEHVMGQYKVKEIHFMRLQATTAVRIRTEDQLYMSKRRSLVDQLFAGATQTMGGATYELCEETSEKVKTLFRERERVDPKSVYTFQV